MRFFYFSFLIVIAMLMGCVGDSKEFIPDTSEITLDNKYVRFEQLLSQIDTNNVKDGIDKLSQENPAFTELFFSSVVPLVGNSKETFNENISQYLQDPLTVKLTDTLNLLFSSFDEVVKKDLDRSMKLMKVYFPSFKSPNIYTFTSAYNYQMFLFKDGDRDGVGLGLDMFMGSSFPYKRLDPKNPTFSDYFTRTFNKDHIAKKVMESLIGEKVGKSPGNRLLDHMITHGKKLYILNKVMPYTVDSIKHEYSAKQMEWVKNNELEMWSFFFDKDLFYETNSMKIGKYISPSPNSPGMPDTAPGRTANYMGLQIVKAYMDRYPETTINQLIGLKDAQKIMDLSKYKPRRK